MKHKIYTVILGAIAFSTMASATFSAVAQDKSTINQASQPAAASPAPTLPFGVSEVLRLQQARVGEDAIIAYIKNTSQYYGLDANQIIYLRQQGVSNAIITTMLNQPKTPPTEISTMPAKPPSITPAAASAPRTATTSTVTYVQTVPAPYYYQPYYYPAYSVLPALSLSFGWGGGGSYYRGGYYGGWHGGGWHH